MVGMLFASLRVNNQCNPVHYRWKATQPLDVYFQFKRRFLVKQIPTVLSINFVFTGNVLPDLKAVLIRTVQSDTYASKENALLDVAETKTMLLT